MRTNQRETYVDLEYQHLIEKKGFIKIEVIEDLVQQYPNDEDLGKAIREFVNLNK